MNTLSKIWKYLSCIILGFHALYQLAFSTMTLANPQSLEAPYAFDTQTAPSSYLLAYIDFIVWTIFPCSNSYTQYLFYKFYKQKSKNHLMELLRIIIAVSVNTASYLSRCDILR